MLSMFSPGLKPSLADRLLIASSLAKVLLEKIIPTWATPLKLHSDWETRFTGQVLQQVWAVWPFLQHFHCAYHPQSSGLVECTNSISKTQLAKFVEALRIAWAKALPLILLNIRRAPFGTHKLSPFEIVKRCPMHLTSASLDPPADKKKKRDILISASLIASIKNNNVLVEQSFHSGPSGDKELKHHTLQTVYFIFRKRYLQKNSLHSHWEGPCQVLLINTCAASSKE